MSAVPREVAGRRVLSQLKNTRGTSSPDVYLCEGPRGERTVVKTWGGRPAWERRWLGTWLAAREARALGRLTGTYGVPEFVSMPEPWALEMTWLDAAPFPCKNRDTPVPPIFFERLWEIVSIMHSRGMNHGDIRRKNVMCFANDKTRPIVLDLTQSLMFDPRGILARLLLPTIQKVDRLKCLQLKLSHAPDSLTPAEREELARTPFHMKAGKWLRGTIYRPFKKYREDRMKEDQ